MTTVEHTCGICGRRTDGYCVEHKVGGVVVCHKCLIRALEVLTNFCNAAWESRWVKTPEREDLTVERRAWALARLMSEVLGWTRLRETDL